MPHTLFIHRGRPRYPRAVVCVQNKKKSDGVHRDKELVKSCQAKTVRTKYSALYQEFGFDLIQYNQKSNAPLKNVTIPYTDLNISNVQI